MFLLNEIINTNKSELKISEILCLYDIDHNCEFKKGDLVYFDDYELLDLYKFFQTLKYEGNNYLDFINFGALFNLSKSMFDYINCIGEIKKISFNKLKYTKGKQLKKKYTVEINYPDGKVLKFNNIKYLKILPNL